MTINVMLVGLGKIAMGYDQNIDSITWTHLKALLGDKRFKLHCAVDLKTDNRRRFSNKTNAPVFECLDEALGKMADQTDVFVIATPTECHYEQYRKITSIVPGKLLLIEKPISSELSELNHMVKDYQAGQTIMVNLFRLYQQQINDYLAMLSESGNCKITVTYSKGLVHNGIHFITLLLKHFGPFVSYGVDKRQGEINYEFTFKDAIATFKSSVNGLDDNNLIVNSPIGSLYYLSGGRHSFFIDKNFVKNDFEVSEFMHYQKYVYDHVYEQLTNEDVLKDLSFDLAVKAQRILRELEVNI